MDQIHADEYLKTLVSAYVWVASADEGVDLAEMHRYEQTIVQSPFATQFNIDDSRHYFKDMVALFADNYDAAVALTKERLVELSRQKHLTEECVRVCRAAAIADSHLKESEELVLTEISRALGLKSSIAHSL